MNRLWSALPWLMMVAAGACGVFAWQDWRDGRPRFEVVDADRVFDGLKVGEVRKFTYRLRNLTNRPMRVVGAEYT
jgi:hypothetical protein